MKALVIAAALVGFGAAPALAQEAGCPFSKGTSQSVEVEAPTQTQTASSQESTVQPETKK